MCLSYVHLYAQRRKRKRGPFSFYCFLIARAGLVACLCSIYSHAPLLAPQAVVTTARVETVYADLQFLSTSLGASPFTSAVSTSLDLTVGVSTRVCLNFVAMLQEITGQTVDIVLDAKIKCNTKHCIRNVAGLLSIENIEWASISVKTQRNMRADYLIWIQIDNMTFPQVRCHGKFGIYHCLSPYRKRHIQLDDMELLATYDVVSFDDFNRTKHFSQHVRKMRDEYHRGSDLLIRSPKLFTFQASCPLRSQSGLESRSDTEFDKMNENITTASCAIPNVSEVSMELFTFIGLKLARDNIFLWAKFADRVKHTELQYMPVYDSKCNMEASKAVLFVDTRRDLTLRANIATLQQVLSTDWVFHFFVTDVEFVESVLMGDECAVIHDIRGIYDDLDPRKEANYQLFWKSSYLWSSFGSKITHVLTFQSDSWFSSAQFNNSWLDYAYMGAPWCENNAIFLPVSKRDARLWPYIHDSRRISRNFSTGNGGVSLRSVHAMQEIIRQHQHASPVQENEDVFFVHYANLGGYKLPNRRVAETFCLEDFCLESSSFHKTMLADLIRKNPRRTTANDPKEVPFAIHKPHLLLQHFMDASGESDLHFTEKVDNFIRTFMY